MRAFAATALSVSMVAASTALLGCDTLRPGSLTSAEAQAEARRFIGASFTAQGQASIDRIAQDPLQEACSSPTPPAAEVTESLEKAERAKIVAPPDGRYLGDWREGEKLAQNGRGMTWTDPANAPAGGNCYNCHQISDKEISFGTLGPSLYRYGALRGVADPTSAVSKPLVEYTWGKLYDAKATNACSVMPRFGAAHVLTTQQMQDLMALLLDPQSPVNQ